jgi:hypothetical protein
MIFTRARGHGAVSLIERRERALLANQNVNSTSTGMSLPMKDSGLIVRAAE